MDKESSLEIINGLKKLLEQLPNVNYGNYII